MRCSAEKIFFSTYAIYFITYTVQVEQNKTQSHNKSLETNYMPQPADMLTIKNSAFIENKGQYYRFVLSGQKKNKS